MRRLLVLLFLAYAFFQGSGLAAAESPTVWHGTLADKEIIWRLVDASSSDIPFEPHHAVRAQYFFRVHGRYITLQDRGDGWLLECLAWFQGIDCDKPTGMWRLLSISGSEIVSEWRANESSEKTLVHLSPVNEQGKSAWRKLLGEGPRQMSATKYRNGVTYSVLTDPRSGAWVPQLVAGLSHDAILRFNKARQDELMDETADALENRSYGGEEYNESEVAYVSRRWMTWAGNRGGYYGGAHPLSGFSTITYDLIAGERIDARRLFRRSVSPSTGDIDGYSSVDMKRRPRTLHELVLQRAWEKPMPPDSCMQQWFATIADCEVDQQGRPEVCFVKTSEWARDGVGGAWGIEPMLTYKGLAIVSNDTSEVDRACRGVMLTIPWSEAEKLLAPGVSLR